MTKSKLELILTVHAQKMLSERNISLTWVHQAIESPSQKHADQIDPELTHTLHPITENGNRVLRVVYDGRTKPWKIVTVYFDRTLERETMKVHFDEKADALYLRLDNSKVVESEEVRPGIVLDFNEKNEVVGIEILKVKNRVPSADLKKFQFEVA